MASHHQHRVRFDLDEIERHLGNTDYAGDLRGEVRNPPAELLAQVEREDAERNAVRRELVEGSRLSRFVELFACALVLFCVVYFGAQMLRAAP